MDRSGSVRAMSRRWTFFREQLRGIRARLVALARWYERSRRARAASDGDWQLHAAALSDDVLLVRDCAVGPIVAFVPPGVPLCDIEDEFARVLTAEPAVDRRDRWRRAYWLSDDEDFSFAVPDSIEVVSMGLVADEVGYAWAEWLRDETAHRIERLLAAIQPVGEAAIVEDRARRLQCAADLLRREAMSAFPHRRWRRLGAIPDGRGRLRALRPELLFERIKVPERGAVVLDVDADEAAVGQVSESLYADDEWFSPHQRQAGALRHHQQVRTGHDG
jgi:hypothetical protein